ncbi:hypothetical protein CXZ10_07020 [Pleomorphomonas diazotrophica]|uniref:PepSY domain-containing protein n=1 Tax=Pleomorphomonas diazotrophica TaxID=1166257 RepID=A0A1I4S5U6_9HYPH|nr:hypothetical protein [Pleomorphomonas diazotrophica]PKR89924.1 hypothetical protein CXZ10_07020 [Pleomorphomonas diazotrophica]SFM59886.1 hypothetical protein SAMN05192571_10367 [Pleomorphomonas diazotrophica]
MKLIAAGAFVLFVSLTLAGKAEEPTVAVAEVPLTGENSFTQAQAKAWIEDAGYTHVADLVLGTDGVWRGSARLDGNPALVRLDYQGNVTTQ